MNITNRLKSMLVVAICAMCGSLACAQESYVDISIDGELACRINQNFNRLETTKYLPDNVFLTEEQSGYWPGDTEGRTILGLVCDARASHRSPKYLAEIIRRIPAHLNAKGYFGTIYPGKMNEQQLSGNGWVLRGLCEYYQWCGDDSVLPIIKSIAHNLFVAGQGEYAKYPIDYAERKKMQSEGAESGNIATTIGNWMLSTDIGCVFIGMEGLIHAYDVVPDADIKATIDELIARFLQIDVIAIKAQTHATLTACRGLIRYAEITGQQSLVAEAEKRWMLYKKYGMTENYANYNWFMRYDTWTEPCAIVDSYMLAIQLWLATGKSEYRDDAELIYYNALCHAQRYNGGFGCDKCPGNAIGSPLLAVSADEAHWCCTMRGGEGLGAAARYAYRLDINDLYVSFFHSGSICIVEDNRRFEMRQTADYPFGNNIRFVVDDNSRGITSLRLPIPHWMADVAINVNGKPLECTVENGFAIVARKFRRGDVVSLDFSLRTYLAPTLNAENTQMGQNRAFYGPLMLGCENASDVRIPSADDITSAGFFTFGVAGCNARLTPLYHLMDSKVWSDGNYSKQILF